MRLDVRVNENGHLTFVPVRARHALASLTCLPAGLNLKSRRGSSLLLPWDNFQRFSSNPDEDFGEDCWTVTYAAVGRGGTAGISIRCGAALQQKADQLFKECRTLVRRLEWAVDPRGKRLPVMPKHSIVVPHLRELATMRAFADVLYTQKDLRPRLDNADRVNHLASDLQAGWLGHPPPRAGSGRDSTDIHTALRQGGFVHRFGRPLTTLGMPTVEQVVSRVEELMRANPYRADRTNDRAQIERIVRRDYAEVKPWPFVALVDD